MAALQKIRSKSGLLVGIIAVGLLAFVFPWSEVSTFINKMKDKAFVVNGEVVTTGEYATRISQMENIQKIMSGQNSLDEMATSQIREAVYEQMVREMLLDEQAEKLGLAVTAKELEDMIYGENPTPVLYQIPFFINPQTGRFDKAYMMQFLSEIGQDPSKLSPEQGAEIVARREVWAFIENMIKYQRLEEKYSALVGGTAIASDTEAKSSYEDSKSAADIAYVLQSYSALPDSTVQVSDKEIKELYEKRKKSYKTNAELRTISYFIKDVIPSDEDFMAVENEIAAVYEKLLVADNPAVIVNEYSSNQYVDAFMSVSSLPADAKSFAQSAAIGDIRKPVREGQSYIMYKLVDRTNAADSVKLQMIPMPQGMDLKTTEHIADSLMSVIKGGKDFSAVANEVVPGSNGGELGWMNEMTLSGAGIAKECFAASKGDVLKLNLQGQSVLMRIDDKTNPVPKVKLAIVQMPVIVSDKTQNSIDNELNQFVAENGNMENFESAASSNGYAIVPNAVINPSDMFLGNATGTRQVIHWAFNNKVGTVNKFDNISDKRVVAIIKSESKGDYYPISELSATFRQELVRDKKAEKMITDLKAKNLTTLDEYAQAIGGRIDTAKFVTFQTSRIVGRMASEPIMNVVAKRGQLNKVEAPLKGMEGVYVMDVINKTEDTKEYDSVLAKQQIKQANSTLGFQAYRALLEKMKVEDNRVKFW